MSVLTVLVLIGVGALAGAFFLGRGLDRRFAFDLSNLVAWAVAALAVLVTIGIWLITEPFVRGLPPGASRPFSSLMDYMIPLGIVAFGFILRWVMRISHPR